MNTCQVTSSPRTIPSRTGLPPVASRGTVRQTMNGIRIWAVKFTCALACDKHRGGEAAERPADRRAEPGADRLPEHLKSTSRSRAVPGAVSVITVT